MNTSRDTRRPGHDRDDEPRLRLVLDPKAIYPLAKAYLADPGPTGEAAEVARAAVRGDAFDEDDECRKCGTPAGLFCWQERLVTLCPACTTDRIERLAGAGHELHPTVLWLHRETTNCLRQMARAALEKRTISFDDLYRCHRWRAFVLRDDVRYWGPDAGNVQYPHCGPCREIRASGREAFVPPEEPPLDLGADPADWTRPDAAKDA